MRTTAFALSVAAAVIWPPWALAQRSPVVDPNPPPLASDARVDFAPEPPEGRTTQERQAGSTEQPPPTRPRARGLVVESTLGVLAFAGEFRHVAPPAYWSRVGVGYEVLSWLMPFVAGELAFTDTSEAADPSHVRAFPLWGVGGGVRASLPVRERFALIGQAEVGALAADVPHGALANLGYASAEALGLQFGGRLGGEWHQSDRHLAFCAFVGARDVPSFAKSRGSSSLPIMWDMSVGLRYAF